MPNYTIQPGDYVAHVAETHGFRSYLTIYQDGANAQFRKKRPNPDILFPGDVLVIPEKEQRNEEGATEKRHRFVAKRKTRVKIRLVIKNSEFKPLANKHYILTVGAEKVGAAGDKKTGADGLIEHDIDASVSQAKLEVFLNEEKTISLSWTLSVGHLDPISEVSGVKGRLNNLGFDCGAVDSQLDDRTVKALKEFRAAVGISVSSSDEDKIDPPTRDRIQTEHGS